MRSQVRLAIVDSLERATAELVRHHQTWSLGYIQGIRNAVIPKYVAKEVQSVMLGENEADARPPTA
jgi:hypothetical protein